MHTSSRQIFTKADRPTVDSAAIIISAVKTPEQRTSATPASPAERPSSTVLVRRNSTSSLATSPADIVELPPSLLTSKPTATSKSKITRQSPPATPASQDDSEAGHLADVQLWRTLLQAKEDGDVERVQAEVKAMRESSSALSTQMYNIAMDALMTVRTPGQPINIILELYNELLTRGLRPNSRTYRHVINALCERDHEIHKVLAGIDRRVKRSTFIQTGRGDSEAAIAEQQQRAANLRDEPNFTSALALFRAGIAFAPTSLPSAIYNVLLRSCAYHKNVDAAVLVYGHLEKVMPGERGAFTFANLISVYASVGDFGAIQEVFKEYLAGATAGTIKSYDMRLKMIVWNRMIEAGFLCSRPDESVKVFEQMLDSAVIAELASDAAPPKPSASTYTAVVQGFCEMGDVDSALAWFDQLLAQNAAVHDPYIPLSEPARPTRAAWVQILSALTEHHRAEDLNRLFSVLLERRESDNLEIRSIDVEALVAVNIRSIRSSGDAQEANEQLSTLTGTLTRIFHDSTISPLWMQHPVQSLVQELSTHNRQNDAAVLMESFVRSLLESPAVPEEHRSSGPFLSATREFYAACVETIFANGFVQSPPSLQTALSLARLGDNIGSHIMWPHCARLYADMRIRNEPVELTEQDKADLVEAFCYPASPGPIDGEFSLAIFLEELAKDAPDSLVPLINWRSVAQALTATHGVEQARAVLDMFNPTIAKNVLPSPPSSPTSLRSAAETLSPSTPPTSVAAIEIDHKLSRYIDEHQNSRSGVSPMAAYDIFENGLVKGLYPSPETLGRLINALGRLQQTDKVHRLYAVAQDVLASLEHDKQWQTQGWFQIEDHMIVALAHSGSFEAASVHRYRIIENGGAPSPDAYGALITAVKDTTDDTTVARELWDESQRLGVTGNLFLYNTIISKLSKARKADYALELFHRMRMEGIRPSSVTYGALIGACCRVGDEQSAEYLFAEMTSMKNFKARVPPFNTMMQFYTSTKPDRERALHYYDALLRSGVRPTAHTYKVC
jgi:pentatricopeptide repeat protein